ncbi:MULTISPECIES: MetQ/NlpA family ABC transporter substrate-binding protein [unclassified Campylobacter]|uniref:MetQ/NlpA family ABC transporter substrate-binding protein n=1 Tax=unclassified Campylobacter TaxID=2593542 RepID=UPI0012380566|nr:MULTISPECIES: MetQ/NlpA family ABC transporter substrate-binding protein [unclassified Campylobacter]KAA6226352.1 ABC transporter substrate-binding protein [Campylobacter sp. LR286c]KAA6230281.1 ABC transporter substrate-binding protein [Campylobacter sp. LR291e]
MNIKAFLFSAFLALSLNAAEKIVVAATPVPHAEILEEVKADLKAQGYELVIKEFNDYIQPNIATDNKEVDANFFQHIPYMQEFNNIRKTKLVIVGGIHIEPMAVYSKKFKSLEDVKNGALIAVPNDPTNESRALDLIAKTGLISFKNDNALKTPLDIKDNPKNLKFSELKAAQVPRVLSDADFAIINSNYALSAKLNPVKDSVLIESSESPYVNVLVTRQGRENEAKIQALLKALQSQKVKDFILKKYEGSVVPAF